jgi:tetratricopeptide (TPR) repeat protein
MQTDFEYQSTRAFNRDAFNAMFADRVALADEDDETPNETEKWDRSRFEEWQRSRRTPTPAEPVTPVAPLRSPEEVLADVLDQKALSETVRGDLVAARALHEQAMEIRRQVFGESDPGLAQSFTWIGCLAIRLGHLEQARWLHEQARQLIEKHHGPDHPLLGVPLHNLAVTARYAGDPSLAAELYERALALKLEHLGWLHPSVAVTLCNLGNLCRLMDNPQAALCHYAQAREIFEQTQGGVNAGLATALIGLGRIHLEYGVPVSAAFMFERAVRIREAIEVMPVQLASARLLLATALARNNPEEAREVLCAAMKEYQRAGETRPECEQAMRALAESLPRS